MTRVLDHIQTSNLIPQSVRMYFCHTTTRVWLHIHHCPDPIMDIYGHVGWVSCGVRDVLMWGDGERVVYCSEATASVTPAHHYYMQLHVAL